VVRAVKKETGSKIVYNADPAALVERLIEHFYNTSDGKFLLNAKGPGELEP
jgi:hypothetical protein